jgi:hypothetical protein
MKPIVSAFLTVLLTTAMTAQAHDCTISESVLLPYTHGNAATRLQWRQSGDAFENLYARCPAGPADRASRAIFFQLVDLVFKAGETAGRGEPDLDRSEAAWESANQYEFDLRQYMDRIVNEKDVEFKSVILKTANGLAISRLGPDVKYDVFRIANVADPATVGAGHHAAYIQAFAAIGYWIDPDESRFASDEKREMTNLLLSKLSPYADRPLIGQPYAAANSLLTALAHSDSPEVMKTLQDWSANPNTTLRDEAARSYKSVKARLAQTNR